MATEAATRSRRRASSEQPNNKDDHGKSSFNPRMILIGLSISLLCVYGTDIVWTLCKAAFTKDKAALINKDSNNENNGLIKPDSFPWGSNSINSELRPELREWLKENDLEQFSSLFSQIGVVTLVSVVQLEQLTQELGIDIESLTTATTNEDNRGGIVPSRFTPGTSQELRQIHLSHQDRERLKRAAHILRQRLILRLWLDDHGLMDYAAKLNGVGVTSIDDVYWFDDQKRLQDEIGEKILPMYNIAKISLPSGLAGLESLKNSLWNRIIQLDQQSIWNTWGTMLLVTLSVAGFGAVASYFPQVLDAKQAILQYVSGKFTLANNCQVEFDWKDPVVVGTTVTFTLRFFQRGGRAYPICDRDNVLIEVKQGSHKVAVVTEFGGQDPEDANLVVVKFSVRKSGQYTIHVLVENAHVRGSPFLKTFLPGPVDPYKTLLLKQTSTVVCVTGQPHKLTIEPRDGYGNMCRNQECRLECFNFSAEQVDEAAGTKPCQNCSAQFTFDSSILSSLSSTTTNTQQKSMQQNSSILNAMHSLHSDKKFETEQVSLQTRFIEEGVYHGTLTYDDKLIQNGKFDIIVLSSTEAAAVQKNVSAKTANAYYEGKLLSIGNDIQNKVRKVYVSISSKQLVVKEYFLKVLPMRVATFRLSPNTKLQFIMANNLYGVPTIVIDDGSQPTIKIALKDAKIVVATFTHFLLKNIGGSETFQDKQEHFFKELRETHRKHARDKITLKITRENILESTWKATKGLSSTDWCRNFEISFVGEQGIDWGGLRREWFEQVCTRLFEGSNPVGMFISFGESQLVHPNPNTKWKGKQYEMAGRIVGKCLYESSLGSAYRQMVKARFTRSFLAQLIGLRVHYKYFEQDDPELYLRKIKFILENDVEEMDLTFTEEEYDDSSGKLLKTVELIPDGSKTPVTNENKREYLNALAQYRLATKVKAEVEAFLKGLNEIVPDELMSIFDENELELLMCGTSEYSVTELREHHIVSGATGDFRKILDWFWTAVANMSEEEKARLLQFTTGCSQLPPGGFRELSPLFQITPAPTYGNLPTAHTCFNQLCLPDYDNYENFEKALRIAINEGSEGFGLV